jgi:hypothetical protein
MSGISSPTASAQTGVEFWHGDEIARADAGSEVILSAGAIGSPQILQLSGVGPAALLGQHGDAGQLVAYGDRPMAFDGGSLVRVSAAEQRRCSMPH